jgi:hypothetical protein
MQCSIRQLTAAQEPYHTRAYVERLMLAFESGAAKKPTQTPSASRMPD